MVVIGGVIVGGGRVLCGVEVVERKKKKELDVDGAKKRLRGLRMVCKKTEWALENRREKKPDHANSWGEEGQG